MNNLIFEDEKLTEVNERIKLIQKKNGLTFGTDAFLLASFVKEQKNGVAVELGGGTGIISLLCASRNKFKSIYCVEIQEDFANIIRRNASLNGLDGKITSICEDVRNLKSVHIGCEVDSIFANPPYMKADSGKRNEHDEKFIARHEVFGDIGDFCACAKRLLKHGGYFYCVWRPDRLTDLLCSMRENSLEPKELCFVHANTNSTPSMALVKAKKGAAPSLSIMKPLFLNKDSDPNALTDWATKIYEECNFNERT